LAIYKLPYGKKKKEKIIYENLQFWTILLCFQQRVSKKRT
jgi:hypothetical protein